MKIYSFFILLFGLFLLESCRNNPSNSETVSSYEVKGNDTVNRLTVNLSTHDSVRQGKWVPSQLNNLKDTVYYKDEIIQK